MGRWDAVSDRDYEAEQYPGTVEQRQSFADLRRMARCPHLRLVYAPGLVMDGSCEDCGASAPTVRRLIEAEHERTARVKRQAAKAFLRHRDEVDARR